MAAASLSSSAQLRSAAFAPRGVSVAAPRAPLRVVGAITKEKKAEIVSNIKGALDDSMLMFGMRYQGLSVKQMEAFRRKMPLETTVMVAKNTLVKQVVSEEGYTQWGEIAPACKQDNVWIFAPEEQVAGTVKAYLEVAKELQKEAKANDGGPTADISGGVMDGKLLDINEIKKLEKMPTKKDLMAKTAMLVKAVPTKLARTIKEVPAKTARAINELADKENPDRDAVVGDVFPKSE